VIFVYYEFGLSVVIAVAVIGVAEAIVWIVFSLA
jgi:hypothetical protein